ncbi:hypothetical protein B723_28210 [Pseudomonas fluorescens NCIMB 11764]|uniref:Uncharacterized protein n=1 Tax=Pseudomonas fluorescens NCIMB 11764 TaxID=1221522 RepID=A0A0K1QX61_PSEFL|nr:hypothetical protein B723_28210 [Pseudomonas fluorescens NCIMB 11764]
MVSTVEKYALETEIFTLSRVFRAQISRSSAQKKAFSAVSMRQCGRSDFFNRIGRYLSVVAAVPVGQVECKQLVSGQANGGGGE